jgi:threonine dehydratase
MTPDDIETAAERIAPHVRRTPVIELAPGEFGFDFSVCLKLEFMQHAGSFKARGAFNRMLSAALPPQGVIAASGGNHGLAVAYAARQLGVPAEIFVPEISAPVKIRRLRELSATVHVTGRSYAEAWQACEARQRETGALVVHAYDQPEVVAGQGTAAREFERQCPGLDAVVVAVGGGGLIGGVAAWHAGHKRVVGVEPATSRALHAALSAGEPVDVEVSGIAADSLGARRVGSVMFPIARRYVERVVLVDDEAIAQARHVLWRELRIVAEPGGAAAFASLLCGAWRPAPGQRVGVLVCGANCDPAGVDVPA